MELSLVIILAALSILLLLVAVILNHQVAQAQALLEHERELRSAQAREIETLRGKAQALELHLQLKRRPPPKRQALDPVAVKLKLVGAITRAMDEVLKNG